MVPPPPPFHHPTQSQEDVKKTTCLSFCIPMLDIFKQYSAHTSEIKIIICTPKMHICYSYLFQKYLAGYLSIFGQFYLFTNVFYDIYNVQTCTYKPGRMFVHEVVDTSV